MALAGAALEALPADGLVPRGTALLALGYGLLLTGSIGQARSVGVEAAAEGRAVGDALAESLALALDAQAHLLEGPLAPAARIYGHAVTAGTVGAEPLPSAAIAEVQLAEVRREQGELDDAERMLRRSIATCESALWLPEWVFAGNITLARVLLASGDLAGAQGAAARAALVLEQTRVPQGMLPIVARALIYRARFELATGGVERVEQWLQDQPVALREPPDPSRWSIHAIGARVALARGEHERACETVDRLAEAAADAQPVGMIVELGIVKSLGVQALGRHAEAGEQIVRALSAAEPHGYVRAFVDEGAPMLALLRRMVPPTPELGRYGGRLAAVLRSELAGSHPSAGPSQEEGSPEELSEREVALLRMFAVGRSNQEIAGELFLSVNTVKWHARNIYRKLGVNRRALAVARARAGHPALAALRAGCERRRSGCQACRVGSRAGARETLPDAGAASLCRLLFCHDVLP